MAELHGCISGFTASCNHGKTTAEVTGYGSPVPLTCFVRESPVTRSLFSRLLVPVLDIPLQAPLQRKQIPCANPTCCPAPLEFSLFFKKQMG